MVGRQSTNSTGAQRVGVVVLVGVIAVFSWQAAENWSQPAAAGPGAASSPVVRNGNPALPPLAVLENAPARLVTPAAAIAAPEWRTAIAVAPEIPDAHIRPVRPPTQAERRAELAKPAQTLRTGVVRKKRAGVAPLKIEAGDDNYAIKMVRLDGAEEMLITVAAGKTFEGKAPLGTFRFRVASGEAWYGPKDLFGPETRYFELKLKSPRTGEERDKFSFSRSGNKLRGHFISLRGHIDGNLENERIPASRF